MMMIAPINQLSPKAPYLASPSLSVINLGSLEISLGLIQVIFLISFPNSGTFVGSLKRDLEKKIIFNLPTIGREIGVNPWLTSFFTIIYNLSLYF